MKIKTAVLTSAAVLLLSTNAMAHHTKKANMKKDMAPAMDITSPFYLPSEGKMLSDTTVEYTRINTEQNNKKGNENEGWYAKETITYGVSDNMSVFAAIGNTFDNTVDRKIGAYNNSHNFDYTVGVKYNHDMDKFMTQFSLAYNTYEPNSFGTSSSTTWNKYVDLGAKVGYKADCGMIPYVSFNANYGLNTVENTELNPLNSPKEDHFTYVTYAGVYKAYDKFSTDMGIRWENVRRAHKSDTASRDDVYAQATVNYKIDDTMSVGIYGDYIIGDSVMADIDYGYTMGANLRIAF